MNNKGNNKNSNEDITEKNPKIKLMKLKSEKVSIDSNKKK